MRPKVSAWPFRQLNILSTRAQSYKAVLVRYIQIFVIRKLFHPSLKILTEFSNEMHSYRAFCRQKEWHGNKRY